MADTMRRRASGFDSSVDTVQDANQEIENWIQQLEETAFDLDSAPGEIENYMSKRSNIETVVDDREQEARQLLDQVQQQEQDYQKKDHYDEDFVPIYIYENLWAVVEAFRHVLTWRNKENVAQHTIIRKVKALVEEQQGRQLSNQVVEETKDLIDSMEGDKLDTFEELMKDRISSVEEDVEKRQETMSNDLDRLQNRLEQVEKRRDDEVERLRQERQALQEQVNVLVGALQQVAAQHQEADSGDGGDTAASVADVGAEAGDGSADAVLDELDLPVSSVPAGGPAAAGDGAAGPAASTRADASERSDDQDSADEEPEAEDDADTASDDEDEDSGSLSKDVRRVFQMVDSGTSAPDEIRQKLETHSLDVPAEQMEELLDAGKVDEDDLTKEMKAYLESQGVLD
jgi:hypothetical protein